MVYPQTEGKHGPIYQISEGIFVSLNEFGSWKLILRRGCDRKKKAIGKGDDNLTKAIKAAELLAAKLELPLNREENPTTKRTFSMSLRNGTASTFSAGNPAHRKGTSASSGIFSDPYTTSPRTRWIG